MYSLRENKHPNRFADQWGIALDDKLHMLRSARTVTDGLSIRIGDALSLASAASLGDLSSFLGRSLSAKESKGFEDAGSRLARTYLSNSQFLILTHQTYNPILCLKYTPQNPTFSPV